jgi:hypothetical protein
VGNARTCYRLRDPEVYSPCKLLPTALGGRLLLLAGTIAPYSQQRRNPLWGPTNVRYSRRRQWRGEALSRLLEQLLGLSQAAICNHHPVLEYFVVRQGRVSSLLPKAYQPDEESSHSEVGFRGYYHVGIHRLHPHISGVMHFFRTC